tara:strand:- start:245 stop:631 length:387 start_codon:yes stop_codon:yes gene_type:complete
MSGLTRLLLLMTPVIIIIFGLSMLEESSIESINTGISNTAFAFLGSGFGVFYFMVSEMGMADNNRSYVANPLTDVLAFIGTGWLIIRAFELDEGLLILVGCAIFVIHVLQLAFKQGFNFDSPNGGFFD